jgi:glycosyltransferase involved in cell wall biosynthesis
MRIAILADPIDNQKAGIHVYAKELVKALEQNPGKHEYILIREKKDPSIRQFRQVIVPNTRLPIGFATIRLLFIIPLICRWLKVDAVWELAHFGPFNLPKRIKRFTTIHDLTPIKFPQYHRWHSQMLQKIFLKKILRKATLIFSNSQNTTNDIIEYFPGAEEKICTAYLGIEDIFKPDHDKEKIRKYGIQKPYFLFMGTIEPRKNLVTLLKAYQLLREKRDLEIQLVIAGGKGWKSGHFFEVLADHPNRQDILLPGYIDRDDLPALYTQALAFVYPSEYEGFGFPVLEAMRCGTCCIVARNSSLVEIGGKGSLYFDTGDEIMLACQMIDVIRKPEEVKELEDLSLHHSLNFTWQAYAMAVKDAINRL